MLSKDTRKLERKVDRLEKKLNKFEDSLVFFKDTLLKMQQEKNELRNENYRIRKEFSGAAGKMLSFLGSEEVQQLLRPIKDEVIDTRNIVREMTKDLQADLESFDKPVNNKSRKKN